MSRHRKELQLNIYRELLPEDIPVRGNVMVSGDDALDQEVEDEIIARLDRGDIEAWCMARVTAEFALDDDDPICYALDHLGGLSYPSEAELWEGIERDYELTKNATREALEELLKIIHVAPEAVYRRRGEAPAPGYAPRARENLARALQRWLAQNPEWAVFVDQWLEKNA